MEGPGSSLAYNPLMFNLPQLSQSSKFKLPFMTFYIFCFPVRSAISPTPRSATGIELHTGPENTYPSELVMDPKKLQAEPPHHQAKPSQEKEKKSKFQIPWWFRVVAWLLLWGGVIASAAIVTALGITFGDAKAKKWITSMLVSFATSIFLTQPLQASMS